MTDVQDHLGLQRLRQSRGGQNQSDSQNKTTVAPRSRLSPDALSGLAKAIEAKIIPSLVLAHRAEPVRAVIPADRQRTPQSTEIIALAEKALAADVPALCAEIETLRLEGRSLETIYAELLAPAASYLRMLWHDDLCGFAEVTLALWRLQQVLREFSLAFQGEAERLDKGRRALLVPAPREKHDLSFVMFGLAMMSQFLRRDGWDAWIEPDATTSQFADIVRSQWFDVVEFLVSGDKQLDALAAAIRQLRRDSPNRSVGVMVCGQVFIEHPELVLLLGADSTAADARQGVLRADGLMRLKAEQS
jgi:MerR family transcriptional regulator, light-induced transcriptional regulator